MKEIFEKNYQNIGWDNLWVFGLIGLSPKDASPANRGWLKGACLAPAVSSNVSSSSSKTAIRISLSSTTSEISVTKVFSSYFKANIVFINFKKEISIWDNIWNRYQRPSRHHKARHLLKSLIWTLYNVYSEVWGNVERLLRFNGSTQSFVLLPSLSSQAWPVLSKELKCKYSL